MTVKYCEVCGKSEGRIISSKIFNKLLCDQHYIQMQRQGKILERTRLTPNSIVFNNNNIEIALYNNNGMEVNKALVSSIHLDKIKDYKWSLNKLGYVQGKINGDTVLLHRWITNAPKGMYVDHRNHNTLDCTDDNLRVCTNQENVCNKAMRPDNTSGHIGVSWSKQRNKWIAQITFKGKNMNLGGYSDINDAIAVRMEAEIKYFGEFRYVQEEAV